MTRPSIPVNATTRPVDAPAAFLIFVLCFSWGFNQVAVKLALHDFPPLTQSAIRSGVAATIVLLWSAWRGIRLFGRDGSLWPGLAIGILFTIEFQLFYFGLTWTTASRAVLFFYLAPFFVALGGRVLLPSDRFHLSQWAGLGLSFAGVVVAFGLPTPSADPHQLLGDLLTVGAAVGWASITLIIKASALQKVSAEKALLYQLVVSAPLHAAMAVAIGEHWPSAPTGLAVGALAYQAVWVVGITYLVWYALILRYSASRLSAFTFLAPLFGVFAGHLVLGEPLTPAFVASVVLVAAGLVVVNRPR